MDSFVIILIVVLILVLMWRGPKNLPKLGEALGRGVKEAKAEAAIAQAEIQARVEGAPAEETPVPPGDGSTPDRPA